MKKITILLAIFTICITPIIAQGQKESKEKPVIAVSIIPEATFVDAIAQGKVDIVTMIPKGGSPENYEPTPQERIEFEQADIYFAIGVPSEEHSILDMASENTKIVDLSTEVEKTYAPLYFGDTRDPHIWLSPKRVLLMIDIITNELSILDSDNADFYKANAEEYKTKLNQAIKKIDSTLKDAKNRSFLVFHPAFNYFAQDFNLKMYSIEEEGKEVTPKSLTEIIDIAKQEGIKNIYYQAEIAAEQSIAFSKELGGKAILLDPLSPNYIENLEIMANTFKDNM